MEVQIGAVEYEKTESEKEASHNEIETSMKKNSSLGNYNLIKFRKDNKIGRN